MNLIRNTRLKKRITQKQLADMIGVTQAYISKIESEQFVNISLVEIIKLSKSLQLKEIDVAKYFLDKYNNSYKNEFGSEMA